MKKRVLGTAILAAALVAGALTVCSDSGKEITADTTAAPTTAEDTTAAGAETETTVVETEAAETTAAGEMKKTVVGASPAPHAEILNVAKEVLVSKSYELDIVEYTDYVLPNNALDSGSLDANYSQYKSHLDSLSEQNGIKLVGAGAIHYEPFGTYAEKMSSLDGLKDKATVLVPNDVSNEAKALLLLEAQGLIKSKEGAGLETTRNDTAENPKNLDIAELEIAQLPRSPPDCDIAVINGNYATEAGLEVSDALMAENPGSLAATTYGNIVAVREGNETTNTTKALVEALTSLEVKQFTEEKYEGVAVPLF